MKSGDTEQQPCKKCGVLKLKQSRCDPCKVAYQKAYRQRTAEKRNVYMAAWRDENKEKIAASVRAWKSDNSEKNRAYGKSYSDSNRERINDNRRKRAPLRKAIKAEQDRAWRVGNLDKWNARSGRYRAVKRARFRPYDLELLQLVEIEAYNLCLMRLAVTGFKWSVDHMVPLRSEFVTGFHNEFNLAVIPATLNISKSNRYWPDMP